jgi:hypothetical protein
LHLHTLVVLSSCCKASPLQQAAAEHQGQQAQEGSHHQQQPDRATEQHKHSAEAEQQQQQVVLQEPFQVAEWACRAPSLRARALAGPGLGLLSEWGLAEMLGTASSDAVMDCIAWRG